MAWLVPRRTALLTAASLLAGCAGFPGEGQQSPELTDNPAFGEVTQMDDLTLTSPAFEAGETIPDKYGKAYRNVNPPLTIDGVPGDATSLALIMDDPDAPGGTFTHWLVWNVPPDVGELPEGWTPPEQVVQGENDFGSVGYGGPKPPSEHTYRFKLYALDVTLDLSSGAGKQTLGDAMEGHVVAQTQLNGTFVP